MKQLTASVILILLSASLLFAEEVSLTLDEALSIAIRDNRDILLSAQEVERAKSVIKEAWSAALPSVNLDISRLSTQRLRSKPYSTTEIHAGLQQLLFASGRVINTVQYAEYSKEAQEKYLDSTKLNIVLKVKQSFCTAILSEHLCQVNKEMLDNIQEHLDFLEARYKNGQASESDLLTARASLASVKSDYETSLNEREAALAALRNLLYIDEGSKIKPVGEFVYEPMEIAYDKAILQAFSRRPEIKQYEAQIKANKKAVAVARTGNLPAIYATWDNYSGDRFLTTTGAAMNKWKNYNVWGITMSWPIFDGLLTRSKIEQALVGLKEAQLIKEQTAADIALEVKNSYLALKDALSEIESAESDLKLYEDNLSVVKEKYKEGQMSFLDVSDADLKYALSQFNHRQALYDYIIAKNSFEKATGGMYASVK